MPLAYLYCDEEDVAMPLKELACTQQTSQRSNKAERFIKSAPREWMYGWAY